MEAPNCLFFGLVFSQWSLWEINLDTWWIVDVPAVRLPAVKQFSWIFTQDVRDPLQNVIVKSVGHSSVCGVSMGFGGRWNSNSPKKTRRHVTFTSFSPCFQNGILRRVCRSRSLQRVFREELLEAKAERRGEATVSRRWRCHGGFGRVFFLLGTYGVVLVLGLGEYYFSNILQLLTYFLNRVIMQVGTFPPPPFVLEELELMTAQLFDGQQVQQAVQKALTSLEAAVVRWPWSWK